MSLVNCLFRSFSNFFSPTRASLELGTCMIPLLLSDSLSFLSLLHFFFPSFLPFLLFSFLLSFLQRMRQKEREKMTHQYGSMAHEISPLRGASVQCLESQPQVLTLNELFPVFHPSLFKEGIIAGASPLIADFFFFQESKKQTEGKMGRYHSTEAFSIVEGAGLKPESTPGRYTLLVNQSCQALFYVLFQCLGSNQRPHAYMACVLPLPCIQHVLPLSFMRDQNTIIPSMELRLLGLCCYHVVLAIKPGASHIKGTCFSTELYPKTFSTIDVILGKSEIFLG